LRLAMIDSPWSRLCSAPDQKTLGQVPATHPTGY
jgi:hypothetical protein